MTTTMKIAMTTEAMLCWQRVSEPKLNYANSKDPIGWHELRRSDACWRLTEINPIRLDYWNPSEIMPLPDCHRHPAAVLAQLTTYE